MGSYLAHGPEIYPKAHENPRVFSCIFGPIFLESFIQCPWGVGLHQCGSLWGWQARPPLLLRIRLSKYIIFHHTSTIDPGEDEQHNEELNSAFHWIMILIDPTSQNFLCRWREAKRSKEKRPLSTVIENNRWIKLLSLLND